MNQAEWIAKRKGKYMAQILERFEETIEPHLPPEAAGDCQDFKGLVRARLTALATDAAGIIGLEVQINPLSQEMKDSLSPTGQP